MREGARTARHARLWSGIQGHGGRTAVLFRAYSVPCAAASARDEVLVLPSVPGTRKRPQPSRIETRAANGAPSPDAQLASVYTSGWEEKPDWSRRAPDLHAQAVLSSSVFLGARTTRPGGLQMSLRSSDRRCLLSPSWGCLCTREGTIGRFPAMLPSMYRKRWESRCHWEEPRTLWLCD